MPRRVFLECTGSLRSLSKTGIPRVVQSVVSHSASVGRILNLDAIPVVLKPEGLWDIPRLSRGYPSGRRLLDKTIGKIATWLSTSSKKRPRKLSRWLFRKLDTINGKVVQFRPGDTLLLLGLTLGKPGLWSEVQRAQHFGASVGFLLHDLIPLLFPQWCDSRFVSGFDSWFQRVMTVADFAICISEKTRSDLKEHMSRFGLTPRNGFSIYTFRQGAEFLENAPVASAKDVRRDLSRLFCDDAQGIPYLKVSTIEPRKNHGYLLDAFDSLWRSGVNVRLLIIGASGWLCDVIVARIRKHPEWHRRLFMFHDITDRELSYCYSRAKALVFPSMYEGFGRPIVEALHCGIPVLASDIPIHREIGGEFCAYFDLSSPENLARLIVEFEREGTLRGVRSPREFRWPTWEEGTHELLSRIIEFDDGLKNAVANLPQSERHEHA